jgi:hypothetical protein
MSAEEESSIGDKDAGSEGEESNTTEEAMDRLGKKHL